MAAGGSSLSQEADQTGSPVGDADRKHGQAHSRLAVLAAVMVAKQVVICLSGCATRGGAAPKTCQTYDYVLSVTACASRGPAQSDWYAAPQTLMIGGSSSTAVSLQLNPGPSNVSTPTHVDSDRALEEGEREDD